MSYQYDREDQIQKYKGQPKEKTEIETSLWNRFLKNLIPWVTKKWELGNAYLEAKVSKEMNEAEKIKAETNLINLQAEREALEIADLAARIDQSCEEKGLKLVSDEELDNELSALGDKIKLLYIKYGLRISLFVEHDKIRSGKIQLEVNEKFSTPK